MYTIEQLQTMLETSVFASLQATLELDQADIRQIKVDITKCVKTTLTSNGALTEILLSDTADKERQIEAITKLSNMVYDLLLAVSRVLTPLLFQPGEAMLWSSKALPPPAQNGVQQADGLFKKHRPVSGV